jgi:Zn-dependent protease
MSTNINTQNSEWRSGGGLVRLFAAPLQRGDVQNLTVALQSNLSQKRRISMMRYATVQYVRATPNSLRSSLFALNIVARSPMNRSLRIGSVAGIGLFLHWTFVLLVAGLVAFLYYQGESLATTLHIMGLITGLFGCVVLHELGHALTAKYFSVPTRSITLYPIGGMARLERLPDEPVKEFWIAVAGPLVNIAIAIVLAIGLAAFSTPMSIGAAYTVDAHAGATLLWLNVGLAVFNMLPAFPMDGGRVLRALLALRYDYAQATQTAARVGQAMAVLFGFVGVVSFNFVLLFIALFVYIGAQQESQHATFRSVARDTPVRDAMMTRFATLSPDATLGDAVDELLAGTDHDFPIVRDGRVEGMLSRQQLVDALRTQGRDERVGVVASVPCTTVSSHTTLDDAFQTMQQSDCTTVPVVDEGKLVGLLSLENVGELLMVRSALGSASEPTRLQQGSPKSLP